MNYDENALFASFAGAKHLDFPQATHNILFIHKVKSCRLVVTYAIYGGNGNGRYVH
jgi:hypothetical protein